MDKPVYKNLLRLIIIHIILLTQYSYEVHYNLLNLLNTEL